MLPDCMSGQILRIIAALGLPGLQLNFLSTYFTKNNLFLKWEGRVWCKRENWTLHICKGWHLCTLTNSVQFYWKVWFQKISIPPWRKTLWYALPHPPGFSVPRGSLMTPPPPSPQEFLEYLNGDFFMSKWFWYFKKNRKWILTHLQNYGRVLLQQSKLLSSLLFT